MRTAETIPGLQLWALLRDSDGQCGGGHAAGLKHRVSVSRAFLRPSPTIGHEAGTSYLLETSIIQKCLSSVFILG